MTRSGWSDWTDRPWETDNPYVDWHMRVPPAMLKPGPAKAARGRAFRFTAPFADDLAGFLAGGRRAKAPIGHPDPPGLGQDFGEIGAAKVPLPDHAINADFPAHYAMHGDWAPPDADIPVLADPDSVILGIIDTGIAIGHNRFRDAGGGTRFLAAWQQTAPHDRAQPYLPFGTEFTREGIDALLDAHSAGGRRGPLNEQGFSAAAGLVSMRGARGHRELAGRAAHGTLVADLAFGEPPGTADPRLGLIAINLPDRDTVHSSGIFLDYFVIYGIKRITTLADLVFNKSRALARQRNDRREWPKQGFPIVINLSFGKNAGAKDGSDFFHAALRTINAERSASGLLPVQLVIPAGNHNLARGSAELLLPPGAQEEVTFLTQPEDQTPNFLEIWTQRLDHPGGAGPDKVPLPLMVDVIPPGIPRAARRPAPSAGGHRKARWLGDKAALYCRVRMLAGGTGYKIGYLLCTAPTLWQESPLRPGSPSGRWTIVLRNAGKTDLRVHVSAQTDQSIRPGSGTGRAARLERADYRMHEHPSGRLRDSYVHPYIAGGNLDNSPVLRRHGSINTMATASEVIAVAGYRLSDGRPSIFSSTGHGYKLDTDSLAGPTIAFPAEESPAHFGLLGAGAANGSVVAMRGTSFAAALATRWVAKAVLGGLAPLPGVIGSIGAEAQREEKSRPAHFRGETPPPAKIGHGRIRMRPARPARRFDPPM